jgi:predicted nucleotidyltransferase
MKALYTEVLKLPTCRPFRVTTTMSIYRHGKLGYHYITITGHYGEFAKGTLIRMMMLFRRIKEGRRQLPKYIYREQEEAWYKWYLSVNYRNTQTLL